VVGVGDEREVEIENMVLSFQYEYEKSYSF